MQLRAVATQRQRLVPLVLTPLVEANERGLPLDPIVVESTKAFGFTSFSCLLADAPRPLSGVKLYAYTTTDPAWLALYERERYVEVDPRLRMVESTSLPVLWEGASERGRSAREDRFLDDAARFGICSGVVIAQNDIRQRSVIAMFNSERTTNDTVRRRMMERNLSDLVLFAQYFSEYFLLQHHDVPAPRTQALTDREREVLCLVARGMSGARIGRELKLSERTVQLYLDEARHKLGASNRQHAVAKALQSGLIAVSA